MIDTYVPGDVDAIRAVARWLRDDADYLETAASTSSGHAKNASITGFEGEAATAFTSLMTELGNGTAQAKAGAAHWSEKVMAYAGQIDRIQSDFGRKLEWARGQSLRVDGMVVHPPDPVPQPADDETDPQVLATYREYVTAQFAYNDLDEHVGTELGELMVWMEANMSEAPEPSRLAKLVTDLGSMAVASPTTWAGEEWNRHVARLDSNVRDAQQTANIYSSAWGEHPVARRMVDDAWNKMVAKEEAAARAGEALPVGSILRHTGPIGDVIGGIYALATGSGVGETGVSTVGGWLGSAIGGAAMVGSGLGAVVGGTVFGGFVGGLLAVEGYEALVPQDIREAIDSGPIGLWDTIF
ncbi:hypothetical protein [Nocardioides sp. SYSU D00065]|uniref:hypothetical protein n=1 Tax=Nocardioides sp. SYSU D00065 TaxID=2817378 RepID=UPI001B321810|nr:hypothetical protein [Nocardioides sp. SYSU D00065]